MARAINNLFLSILIIAFSDKSAQAITLDDINIMRLRGVQIKEGLSDREYSDIREDLSVEKFINSYGLSFDNIPLVDMPDFIFEMKNLRELSLMNTRLRIESLIGINKIVNLESINMSYNFLLFSSGYGCDDYRRFNCRTTYNKENFPTMGEILDGLYNLKILDVSNVGGVNESSWGTTHKSNERNPWKNIDLRELYISMDERYGVPPHGTKTNIGTIADLSLNHMNLTKLVLSNVGLTNDDSIGAFQDSITYIDISNNYSIGFDKEPIEFYDSRRLKVPTFPKLEYLDISGTRIGTVDYTSGGRIERGSLDKSFYSIFSMPKLKTLKIDSNQTRLKQFLCAKFPNDPSC